MKISKFILAALVICVITFGFFVFSQAEPEKEKGLTAQYKKLTVNPGETPVLKGSLWQTMTKDEKVAFLWGIMHVVTTESDLMQNKFPELRVENFSAKIAEALKVHPISLNDLVAKIDAYYDGKSKERLATPVIAAMWEVAVKPYLKKGIAGKPVK